MAKRKTNVRNKAAALSTDPREEMYKGKDRVMTAEEEETRLINQGTLKKSDQGGKTPVLVSNREVVIRPNIAKIIGLDKLEKINNRGKAETERAIQEEQLAEGNPQPERVQSPKGRMT